MTVRVLDVNEHSPEFTQRLYNVSISEESGPGVCVCVFIERDDAFGNVQYMFVVLNCKLNEVLENCKYLLANRHSGGARGGHRSGRGRQRPRALLARARRRRPLLHLRRNCHPRRAHLVHICFSYPYCKFTGTTRLLIVRFVPMCAPMGDQAAICVVSSQSASSIDRSGTREEPPINY